MAMTVIRRYVALPDTYAQAMQGRELAAEDRAVELEGLFGGAGEVEVGIDGFHGDSRSWVGR